MDQRSRSRSSSSVNSERSSRPPFNPGEPCKKIFVGGLPETATDSELKDMFGACGNINDFFMKKPAEGCPFAFIEFLTINEAQMAIEKFNGKKMGDKMISVKYSKPRNTQGQKDRGNNNGERKPYRQFNNNGGNGGNNGNGGNRQYNNQGPRRDFGNNNGRQRQEGQFNQGNGDNQRGGFGGRRDFQQRQGSQGGYQRGGFREGNQRGGNNEGNDRRGFGQNNQRQAPEQGEYQRNTVPKKETSADQHDY